jgi:hypothetical protein
MKMPTFPCDGGCACGAVRYRLSEDPLELHACHCTDCQAITGSAFVMSMPTHRRSIELLRGEPTLLSFETPDGLRKRHRHCVDCGCQIWSEPARLADLKILQAGTLDDTSWLEPIAHIWTQSAQPWVEIPTDVLRFEAAPPDSLELVRAWKGRNTA